MLKIIKTSEPDFYKDFKKKYRYTNWEQYNSDLGIEIKRKLKKYMLKEEQNYYCPYCERKIITKYEIQDSEKNVDVALKKKSHIEHIIPKSIKPQLFQEYNNFLVSCTDKETCGMAKENNYSDNFINPVLENPQEYFEYDIKTGEIRAKKNSLEKQLKAEETIKILNLNQSKLKNARYVLIQQLYFIKDLSLYKDENFPSLVEYIEKIKNI